MSLVHFPETSSVHQCKCGCKEHGTIRSLCDVTTLKDFGNVPFHMIETALRLRKLDAVDSTVDPVEQKEVKIIRENSAATVPTYESVYDDEDADNSNDVSELASGSQYDEFYNRNSVNNNGSILCDISIGDKSVQIIDTEIDTVDQNSADDGGLMVSEDLGYEFHEDFAPVVLSSVDAAASSATNESISLVESLSDTLNKLIADADAFSEAKKATWRCKMTTLKAVPPVLTTRLIENDKS